MMMTGRESTTDSAIVEYETYSQEQIPETTVSAVDAPNETGPIEDQDTLATDTYTDVSVENTGKNITNIEIYLDGDKNNGINLGTVKYGVPSEDAESIYGKEYANSGFYLSWNRKEYVFEPGSIHYIFFYTEIPGEGKVLTRKEIKLQGELPVNKNIIIYLESPTESAFEGEISISGWAVDTSSASSTNINRIEIYLDGPRGFGKFLGNAQYGLERGDIAELYKNENFINSGFGLAVNLKGLEQGTRHSLYIYAITNSNEYNLYKRDITVKGTSPKTDANIFIETSMINDFNSENIEISGWVVNMNYQVKRIVFSANKDGNEDIYSINLDGSDLKRLTDNPGSDLYPCVSPDAKKILYSSDIKGVWQIMVMNWDGTDKKQLTFSADRCGDPAWSFDGKQIYFEIFLEENWELYKMNADGSNIKRLTINPTVYDWHPYGLSSENKILYESGILENYDLYIMNDDGTNIKKLTEYDFNKRVPSMSKNGRYIVFQGRAPEDKFYNVYIMDADGKNLKRLTEDSTEYGHAIISPDNHFITFEGLLAGQKRLFIMKLDGSEKRQVTTNEDYSTIMPDFIYIK
jgi:Tol biopolymer transport system component